MAPCLTREEIRAVEVGSRLRARALVALDDVDESLASFHAVRLLFDAKETDPSTESALTAVAVRGDWLKVSCRGIEGWVHSNLVEEQPGR